MTYEDITFVNNPQPWDELFRQREQAIHERNDAIAEAEVLRLELQDLAEQRDALTRRLAEVAVLNGQMAQENARLRERLQQIVELHTDSPAGVCPSCGRISEQSDTDDGLVNWPCPTLLIANPTAQLIEAGLTP